MSRSSLKITGAQGQGVNSVGEICGKGLKRTGYCVFGYREYMSLIRGGHSSYQIDISSNKIESSESRVDILVNFNHHGLKDNLRDVKDGGILIHQTPMWKFSDEDASWINEHAINVIYLPVEEILKELNAPIILGNILVTATLWKLLGQSEDSLKEMVKEQFGHKGDKVIDINFSCIERINKFMDEVEGATPISMPETNNKWKECMFLTGSQAIGLGIIHSGCRVFAGYPMTPSSPLLAYIADTQNETGIIVKQAEDEITAVQMMSGAMLMGTRAITTTSGGGFDLMTETVSLNGILENPAVIVLAQRPGPSTGLPTWTAQGDLLLAVNSAHGEFPRLVMSVSNSQDAFDLMPEAFNLAEEFQIPVIVLNDKHIAEGLFTQESYDQKKAEIRRGKLVTDKKELSILKAEDRYDPTVKDGVSKRWLPGTQAVTFCSQGDEHNADGSVDESAKNATEQMDKRMRKMVVLRNVLPEPQLFKYDVDLKALNEKCKMKNEKLESELDVLLIGWGSTKGAVLDSLSSDQLKDKSIGYLHWDYLWPLKTERFEELVKKAKKVICVEGNKQGQLNMLLKQECGKCAESKILKYDGRPFFTDELTNFILSLI